MNILECLLLIYLATVIYTAGHYFLTEDKPFKYGIYLLPAILTTPIFNSIILLRNVLSAFYNVILKGKL